MFAVLRKHGLPLPRTVFQIGASAGQEINQFAANGIQAGVFIEPLQQPFEILQKECARYPGYKPLRAVVSSEDGKLVDFYLATNFGQSSSLLKPKLHTSWYPQIEFQSANGIVSQTADTISKTASNMFPELPSSYELLYMDVQGAELEVISGCTDLLTQAKYLYCEVGYGGGYENDCNYIEVMACMDKSGFELVHCEINPLARYGDALFSKKII